MAGLFWSSGYGASLLSNTDSPLDELLESKGDETSLEELLEIEDILQQCSYRHDKLIESLSSEKNCTRLIDYLLNDWADNVDGLPDLPGIGRLGRHERGDSLSTIMTDSVCSADDRLPIITADKSGSPKGSGGGGSSSGLLNKPLSSPLTKSPSMDSEMSEDLGDRFNIDGDDEIIEDHPSSTSSSAHVVSIGDEEKSDKPSKKSSLMSKFQDDTAGLNSLFQMLGVMPPPPPTDSTTDLFAKIADEDAKRTDEELQEYNARHKYPLICKEIVNCEIAALIDAIFSNDDLLQRVFQDFLAQLPSYLFTNSEDSGTTPATATTAAPSAAIDLSELAPSASSLTTDTLDIVRALPGSSRSISEQKELFDDWSCRAGLWRLLLVSLIRRKPGFFLEKLRLHSTPKQWCVGLTSKIWNESCMEVSMIFGWDPLSEDLHLPDELTEQISQFFVDGGFILLLVDILCQSTVTVLKGKSEIPRGMPSDSAVVETLTEDSISLLTNVKYSDSLMMECIDCSAYALIDIVAKQDRAPNSLLFSELCSKKCVDKLVDRISELCQMFVRSRQLRSDVDDYYSTRGRSGCLKPFKSSSSARSSTKDGVYVLTDVNAVMPSVLICALSECLGVVISLLHFFANELKDEAAAAETQAGTADGPIASATAEDDSPPPPPPPPDDLPPPPPMAMNPLAAAMTASSPKVTAPAPPPPSSTSPSSSSLASSSIPVKVSESALLPSEKSMTNQERCRYLCSQLCKILTDVREMIEASIFTQLSDAAFGGSGIDCGESKKMEQIGCKGLDLVVALLRQSDEVWNLISDSGLIETSIWIFFDVKWNNSVHTSVEQMIQMILSNDNIRFHRILFDKCEILRWLVNAFDQSKRYREDYGMHLGFAGHLTRISNTILSFSEDNPNIKSLINSARLTQSMRIDPTSPRATITLSKDETVDDDDDGDATDDESRLLSTDLWTSFVKFDLTEMNELMNVQLGGDKPILPAGFGREYARPSMDGEDPSETEHRRRLIDEADGFPDDADDDGDGHDDGGIGHDSDSDEEAPLSFMQTDTSLDELFDREDAEEEAAAVVAAESALASSSSAVVSSSSVSGNGDDFNDFDDWDAFADDNAADGGQSGFTIAGGGSDGPTTPTPTEIFRKGAIDAIDMAAESSGKQKKDSGVSSAAEKRTKVKSMDPFSDFDVEIEFD